MGKQTLGLLQTTADLNGVSNQDFPVWFIITPVYGPATIRKGFYDIQELTNPSKDSLQVGKSLPRIQTN